MPTQHIVEAIRDAFTGDWGIEILWGSIWSVVIFIVFLWVGARTFRRDGA
jgi:ABC-2 type transport system permease protein